MFSKPTYITDQKFVWSNFQLSGSFLLFWKTSTTRSKSATTRRLRNTGLYFIGMTYHGINPKNKFCCYKTSVTHEIIFPCRNPWKTSFRTTLRKNTVLKMGVNVLRLIPVKSIKRRILYFHRVTVLPGGVFFLIKQNFGC